MNATCKGIILWFPAPWVLGEGPKGQISLNLNYKVNFKLFKPNFVYHLTNERYITYQTGFSFGHLGHAQGWDLGVPWGVGGSKLFNSEFNQIWCASYLHEWHMHRHNFWVPTTWGRDQKFNFLNMVMWHLWGEHSRTGFNPWSN